MDIAFNSPVRAFVEEKRSVIFTDASFVLSLGEQPANTPSANSSKLIPRKLMQVCRLTGTCELALKSSSSVGEKYWFGFSQPATGKLLLLL